MVVVVMAGMAGIENTGWYFAGEARGASSILEWYFFRGRGDAPQKNNIVGFMYKNMSGIIRAGS